MHQFDEILDPFAMTTPGVHGKEKEKGKGCSKLRPRTRSDVPVVQVLFDEWNFFVRRHPLCDHVLEGWFLDSVEHPDWNLVSPLE